MNAQKQFVSCSLAALLAVGLAGTGMAWAGSDGKEVVGTWSLVSATVMKDGKKVELFGDAPFGQIVFDAQGNYTLVMMRSNLPKFANKNRTKGTDAENAAVVHGSIAHFGTYSYSDKDKTHTLHIKASTFPNWTGESQARRLTVTGDTMHWVNAAVSTGAGTLEITLKRVK